MEGAGLTLHFTPEEVLASPGTLLLCSCSSRSCSPLPVLTEGLTACCAMVTDDRQEIVGGDLGDTLLG